MPGAPDLTMHIPAAVSDIVTAQLPSWEQNIYFSSGVFNDDPHSESRLVGPAITKISDP